MMKPSNHIGSHVTQYEERSQLAKQDCLHGILVLCYATLFVPAAYAAIVSGSSAVLPGYWLHVLQPAPELAAAAGAILLQPAITTIIIVLG